VDLRQTMDQNDQRPILHTWSNTPAKILRFVVCFVKVCLSHNTRTRTFR